MMSANHLIKEPCKSDLSTKEEVVDAVKTFSTRSCEQYFIYNSIKALLKCKSHIDVESPSMKMRGDDLRNIKKYKGPHTCANPIINPNHKS